MADRLRWRLTAQSRLPWVCPANAHGALIWLSRLAAGDDRGWCVPQGLRG